MVIPHPALILGYIVLALIVGFFGRKRSVGFVGMFALSLLFTPFITGLMLAAALPKKTC